MPGFAQNGVWTLNWTRPDPRFGLVQGLVQQNPNFRVGSSSGSVKKEVTKSQKNNFQSGFISQRKVKKVDFSLTNKP
jgi:hypothetical protein